MKTKEELNALKNEVEAMNTKLSDLNDEELEQVIGGSISTFDTMWVTKAVSGGGGNNGVILVATEGADPEAGNAVIGMNKYDLVCD